MFFLAIIDTCMFAPRLGKDDLSSSMKRLKDATEI